MIAQCVEDAVVAGIAHPPERAALVVLGRRAVLPFVDARDVDGGDTRHSTLGPVAVRIVQERRADTAAGHGQQAVVVVEALGIGGPADGATGLIAHRVIAIRVAERARDGVRFRAIRIGVAVVAGDVPDGVVGVGVAVLADACRSRRRRDQPVEPVVAETLRLAAVRRVGQGLDVAGQVVGVGQLLQVLERGGAFTENGQTMDGETLSLRTDLKASCRGQNDAAQFEAILQIAGNRTSDVIDVLIVGCADLDEQRLNTSHLNQGCQLKCLGLIIQPYWLGHEQLGSCCCRENTLQALSRELFQRLACGMRLGGEDDGRIDGIVPAVESDQTLDASRSLAVRLLRQAGVPRPRSWITHRNASGGPGPPCDITGCRPGRQAQLIGAGTNDVARFGE